MQAPAGRGHHPCLGVSSQRGWQVSILVCRGQIWDLCRSQDATSITGHGQCQSYCPNVSRPEGLSCCHSSISLFHHLSPTISLPSVSCCLCPMFFCPQFLFMPHLMFTSAQMLGVESHWAYRPMWRENTDRVCPHVSSMPHPHGNAVPD